MKSKFGFFSAALVAATTLLSSGEASAGGAGGWWGRAGYASLRVRDILACVDSYTAELHVAIRTSSASWCGDFAVTADLWGDAVCLLPPPPIPALPLPPVPVYDSCGAVLLPPVLPPPPPVILPPPGPLTKLVAFDGFPTHDAIAIRDGREWFRASFDLLPLFAGSCGPGYLDGMNIGFTKLYIDGRPYVLDYDLPECGAADWW